MTRIASGQTHETSWAVARQLPNPPLLVIPDLSAPAVGSSACEQQSSTNEDPELARSERHDVDNAAPVSSFSTSAEAPTVGAGNDGPSRRLNASQLGRRTVTLVKSLQAAHKGIASTTRRIRRITRTIPNQSSFGWQRTVLLLVGGALLAYTMHGSPTTREADETAVVRSTGSDTRTKEPVVTRMSRAPLRIAPAETKTVTTLGSNNGEARAQPGTAADDRPQTKESPPAESKQGSRQAGPSQDYPSIGAPDGTKVTRRPPQTPLRRPHETNSQVMQSLSNPSTATTVQVPTAVGSRQQQSIRREVVAQRDLTDPAPRGRNLTGGERSHPRYPRTTPKTWRDPEYVLPRVADRRPEYQ